MTVPSNDDEEQNTEQQLLSMLDTQLLSSLDIMFWLVRDKLAKWNIIKYFFLLLTKRQTHQCEDVEVKSFLLFVLTKFGTLQLCKSPSNQGKKCLAQRLIYSVY